MLNNSHVLWTKNNKGIQKILALRYESNKKSDKLHKRKSMIFFATIISEIINWQQDIWNNGKWRSLHKRKFNYMMKDIRIMRNKWT